MTASTICPMMTSETVSFLTPSLCPLPLFPPLFELTIVSGCRVPVVGIGRFILEAEYSVLLVLQKGFCVSKDAICTFYEVYHGLS